MIKPKKKVFKIQDNELDYLKNRNMTILDFNMRVLMLAGNPKIPIIERLTFIKIVFSNLDEFISVRLSEIDKKDKKIFIEYLSQIYSKMNSLFDNNIEPFNDFGYRQNDKNIKTNKKFNDDEIYYVALIDNKFSIFKYRYIGLDEMDKIVKISNPNKSIQISFLVRFISDKSFRYIYSGGGTKKILEEIQQIVDIKENAIFSYIQTTCSNKQIMEKFIEFLKLNISGYFIMSENILQINSIVDYVTESYHDRRLYYPKFNPIYNKRDYYNEMLESKKDILVYNPYIEYQEVVDFISQMADNDNIESLFITLYRTSDNSEILNSLVRARKKGKFVGVYIEPTARGNESDNVNIIKYLTDNDVVVSCNYFNYKIHSKIFLAIDKIGNMFYHIGTGNYNEKTAKMYTDLHILSTNKDNGRLLYSLFKNIFSKKPIMEIKPILSLQNDIIIAPLNMRENIIDMIKRETEKGVNGRIWIKCNSLCHKPIIEELNKASEHGVDIKLLVRTAVAILPDDNIEIKSKVGRFLEHERIYIFGDDVYIGSADLLERNISKRIEVITRVADIDNIKFIESLFHKKWSSENAYTLIPSPLRWVL